MPALDAKSQPADGKAPVRDLRSRTIVALPVASLDVPAAPASTSGRGKGAAGMAVVIPVRTVSALNVREHWRVRAKRVKAERMATYYVLKPLHPPPSPVVVTMTRVGPSNGLDDDNLRGALKGVRDEIAAWFGIDDRDPRATWAYGQRRGKAWQVEVTFA